MVSMNFSKEDIFNLLEEVKDPEIPVLSVVDLGVVRDVNLGEKLEVIITPTYTGCPAMKVIEDDIKSKLLEHNIKNVEVKTVLSPAWTTDWISENGLKKLKEFGIAPPAKTTVDKSSLTGIQKVVECPYCNSKNTEMKSQFGSTACKALYQCIDCKEPFDHFKCI
jgi:ring-1,2-phenylacetyl-CoA epoxidase subunit PaaD